MKIIVLAISVVSLVHGEGLFLSTAVDGMEIKLRGRDRGPDITQVEVHIRPREVTASGDIPSLEYKEEGGCWKKAPVKSGPTNRGQKKRWRLDLPAPCKIYKFRLAMQSDSCIDYLVLGSLSTAVKQRKIEATPPWTLAFFLQIFKKRNVRHKISPSAKLPHCQAPWKLSRRTA